MTSTRMRWAAGIAAVSAVALVAAGCSKTGAKESDQKAAKKAEQTQKALPGTDMITASRDKIQDGGTLTIALEDYPQNFNPSEIDGNDISIIPFFETTLPDFVDSDEAGNPVGNPDYTQSFKVVSEQPFVVEFKVNPKAVWSDGKQVGYTDFLNMWKANNGTQKAYQIVSTNGWDQITGVTRGANDQDIKVTYKRPYAEWPAQFNALLPSSVTTSATAFNSAWKNGPSVTAGPFMVQKADATSQTITEVPNPHWWGDKPKLTKLVFRSLALNATTGAFTNGEIDAINAGIDVNTLKQAEGVPGTKVLRSASTGFHVMNINAKSPLLKDQKMRQAIALGIDRKQIAKIRLAPFGVPVQVRDNHLYSAVEDAYQDNGSSTAGPNAAKAKQMLDSMGWKMQGKFRVKDGKTLTLREIIPADTSSQTDVSQVVQQSLGNIGVQVKIQTVPLNDFFTKYINVGDYDLGYQGWTSDAYPECSGKSLYYPAVSPQNKTYASSAEIGKLFDQACSTLDAKARHKIGNQLDKAIWKVTSQLSIFTDPSVAVVKDNLANFDFYSSAFQSPKWQDVGWLKKN